MKTTVVVSPRERFSSVIASLQSLFATIPPSVPVIVVEGGSPKRVRDALKSLQTGRAFEWIALDHMPTPNEARNLGAMQAETEFVVFADNDIEYQPGWLDALETNAETNEADVVAPLIFIGPSDPLLIHHAGGVLHFKQGEEGLVISERHRLMNRAYEDHKDKLDGDAPVENEVCEFHCLLMRKAFYDRMGGLDERLITREQMDLALRAKALGGKVTFEKASHVTYLAYNRFEANDIDYHLFRWADALAVRSIEAFEDCWDVKLNEHHIRFAWIERHRRRAVVSRHPKLARILGRSITGRLLTPLYERRLAREVARARDKTDARVPVQPPSAFVESLTALA